MNTCTRCLTGSINARVNWWTRPFTAFLAQAIITGISTGLGLLVHNQFDKDGISGTQGLLAYIACVITSMLGIYTLFYVMLGWGGGMLATDHQIEEADMYYYFKGKTMDTTDVHLLG